MSSHGDSGTARSQAGRQGELAPAVLVICLIILAAALRFWRLGDWNFQATEMFTLRDSSAPQFGNARPLGYVLTYYLVRPLLPLDEFGLRLLPAVFGVLAIPALYFVSRHLVGTRAALFGAMLLAVSPLHVMYSQLARYWSLVFLLSAIYPFAIYLGVRDRSRRMLALGLGTGVLAALAHPVSVLLMGGPLLLLATRLRREHFGFIFQRYQLLGDLDAVGNVEIPSIYAGAGTAHRHARARSLLARLGLAERLHHRPGQLSGGQQQRVSIARALMNGGDVILADEPTGALDSKSGADVMRMLSELSARGHTVILITHAREVAEHAHRQIEQFLARTLR